MISLFARPSRLAVATAIPFMLAAKPLSAPLAGGTTYEFIIRSQSSQSGDKEMVMMRGRGTFAGSDGRIDILQMSNQSGSEQAFGGKGGYFLVLDGGKKMMVVNPTDKNYMEWDIANMMAGMSKVVNAMGSMMKMDIADVKIDSKDLGAGETIQGYPTRHYQMTQNYTVTMKMFGHTSRQHSESTTDYYFAPALKGLANPFMSNNQAWAQSFDMFNNPDFKTQMNAAMSKMQGAGVPLKSVMKTTSTDENGKVRTSTVISEMVNFKNVDVPSSTFAIPAGYTKIEMPKVDANLAAKGNDANAKGADINADSIANAAKEGAKEGVKEGVKEGAKESAAKKIKGIFKR